MSGSSPNGYEAYRLDEAESLRLGIDPKNGWGVTGAAGDMFELRAMSEWRDYTVELQGDANRIAEDHPHYRLSDGFYWATSVDVEGLEWWTFIFQAPVGDRYKLALETIRISRVPTGFLEWRWNAEGDHSSLTLFVEERDENWLRELRRLEKIAEDIFREPGRPGRPTGPSLVSIREIQDVDERLTRRDGKQPSHETLAQVLDVSTDTIKRWRPRYPRRP